VSSPGNQSPEEGGICWLGILRTLLIQVLVLIALAGAVIRYLNWSSDAAWAEFISAGKSSVSDPGPHPQSSTPAQTVKGQKPCYRRT
jgi:hypothetical protein